MSGLNFVIQWGFVFAIAWIVLNACYVLSSSLRFYSLVDAAWSFAFAVAALACAFVGAPSLRSYLFYGMTTVWSLRLGAHLLARLVSHYPREDTRYEQLRSRWRGRLKRSFFLFFQAQAASFIVLGLPLALVASESRTEIGFPELIALALWMSCLLGEILADAQLRRFKRDAGNRGRVCDVGLWRFSRHPNYFFEWLLWCSFAVYAFPSRFGALALLAPAAMYVLLVFVTGIPPSEEQALRSRGESYRVYQRRTNRFLPWFPREGGSHAG